MSKLVRILSDVHYGERGSLVRNLAQLAPLLQGADQVWFNGDTIDTRPDLDSGHVAAVRADLDAFAQSLPAAVRYLTGNHDPDISRDHWLDQPGGVVVTHGDLAFDNIVPWGKDAPLAAKLVAAAGAGAGNLEELTAAHRLACAAIPKRQAAVRQGWRHLVSHLTHALWPPTRPWAIVDSWRTFPRRADALLSQHRPGARFLISGHTHWPGVWRRPSGLIVVNTGSFCPPCGQLMVDLTSAQLVVRKVRRHGSDFLPGDPLREFALTPDGVSA
ncbi:MAG: metallophosphoesterase family protein [Cephaloticoccus sp.]